MLLTKKVVIPTIVFEMLFVFYQMAYFVALPEQTNVGYGVFYLIELLSLLFLMAMSLIVFILFLKDDVYLILDLIVLFILVILDLYLIPVCFIGRDQEVFEEIVVRFSRVLRVVGFYYRMKSSRWKIKRLV